MTFRALLSPTPAILSLPLVLSSLLLTGPAFAVAGGTVADSCGFAPAVAFADCSRTLIHPRVNLYAGNCLNASVPESISFTEQVDTTTFEPLLGNSVEVDHCELLDSSTGPNDIAYCVLKEPITEIPYIPPAWGCELDEYLKKDQAVVLAGCGEYDFDRYDGKKRYAENIIYNITPEGDIEVGPVTSDSLLCCTTIGA